VLKSIIKQAALKAFPGAALTFFSIRSRRFKERVIHKHGLDRLARQVAQATNGKVASGPFIGMMLNYELLPTHNGCVLVGTYEKELHWAIEKVIGLAPTNVLNIGCAEGYYAIGFALRLPQAMIFAAELDPKSVRAARRNAELNGVSDRVQPVGIVKPGQFSRYLKANSSFIMMDCEGCEFDLLEPRNDPILLRTDILVEIHPEQGDKTQIIKKFTDTHHVTEIQMLPRPISDAPPMLRGLDVLSAMSEWRPLDQTWLFLQLKR
jgi:Ribosomal protein L11 methyltransferase (PrmA)